MMILPKIFNGEKIIAAQSDRIGGVSPSPFASLNLGLSVKDAEENVWRNREIFFEGLHISLARLSISHQVHGNDILTVEEPGRYSGYDAQITNKKNIFLVASIADCAPILIHDEKNNAVAAIHAGWKGTAGKIVERTLTVMKEKYGTSGKDCKAFIGACIGYENFEVGEEVAANFDTDCKRFDNEKQKWLVDLKAANKKQLIDHDVSPENIEVSEYCTVKDNDRFFSHRKENGRTGRMMAVIGLK